MANPTTNFGWQMPQNTDLVKDLPADFEVFGQAVDTDLADLKGGTTGQILSKTSNTDLDFTWINNDQGDITEVQAGTGISVASGTGPVPVITNTVATEFDAKGDLIIGTGSDTFDRLAVGSNGYVLTADSAEATGVKWASAASGTPTFVGCSLYKSASQSISNTTSTLVTWDSEVFDTDAFHDTSTNNGRITIPSGKGGYYQFIWIIQFPNNANGQRSASLRKNGTFISFTNLKATNDASIKLYGSFIIDAVATDYFDVTVYQDAGTSQSVEGLAEYSNFQAIYLGA